MMFSLKKQQALSAEEARERIHYDPDTGLMLWKDCPKPESNGTDVGYSHSHGYAVFRFKDHVFLAHRVAWLIFYGEWPSGLIDHIDCNRSNNRISNLRIASANQNCANRRAKPGQKFKGVNRSGNKWRAEIMAYGVRECLGSFKTPEEANAAYARRALEIHGEFARAQ